LNHFIQYQNNKSILQIYFAANFKVTEILFFSNILVTVAPLATHLPASYTTLRDITMYRGAFHSIPSGAKKAQSTSHTVFI